MQVRSGEMDYHLMRYILVHKDNDSEGYPYGCAIWLSACWGVSVETIYSQVRLRLKALKKEHGFLESCEGDATDQRAGQPRAYYKLTDNGLAQFQAMEERLKATMSARAKGDDDAVPKKAI